MIFSYAGRDEEGVRGHLEVQVVQEVCRRRRVHV